MKRRYDRWTSQRTARAAFLLGRGHSPVEIAADAGVESTLDAVKKMFSRIGLATAGDVGGCSIRLPPALMRTFEDAGRARQMTTDKAFREAMRIIASDAALLDNIFDDGIQTA